MGYWNQDGKCLQCGQTLKYRRSDAKFCDANCRKAWSRRKDKITAAAANARGALSDLRQYGRDYADLRPEVAKELRLLLTDVKDLLLMYDPEKQRDAAELNELVAGVHRARGV